MPQIITVLTVAALLGVVAATGGILFIDGAAAAARWQAQSQAQWHGGVLLLLPAGAGLVCALIAKRLPGGIFLGLADMVLQEQRGGQARLRHHLLSSAAAFAALVGGASVGQYGPVAHLGGALATRLGRVLRQGLPPRTAAACGIAAAVAAAFNAPFTGLVFAHEVVLRHYSLRAFTPVAIAAVVGHSVSTGVFARPLFLELPPMAALSPLLVLLFVLMGLLFGVFAVAYLRGIFWIAHKCRPLPLLLRLPAAGFATGVVALSLTGLPETAGMVELPTIVGGGKELLTQASAGLPAAETALLLAAKAGATMLCLGAGFAGGVVSPTLASGALAGALFFHLASFALPALPQLAPLAGFALAGMMALTAPVIGAPLAGILFTMELTGSYPLAIAAAVSIAVAVQTAAKLNGTSYYNMQLAARGIDIRLRRDEWRLATETIAPLICPPAARPLPPNTPLAQAIEHAVQARCGVVHVADDGGCYHGSRCLPALLAAQRDGRQSLAAGKDGSDGASVPPLRNTDTILAAMQKTEETAAEEIAVVDGGGAFVGVISKGTLLQRYDAIMRATREEERAVS